MINHDQYHALMMAAMILAGISFGTYEYLVKLDTQNPQSQTHTLEKPIDRLDDIGEYIPQTNTSW